MNPCKIEKLYFFHRRKSIEFKQFRKSNNFFGSLEWTYTYKVCLTRKKKEVDATITEKFLSFSTSNNKTSSCWELNVFARILKNEIMVMKLKLWIFRPTWCAGLVITSHQFQAWFLQQVEKTTFLIKIFQDSCCKCKGKNFFKLVLLASFRCLRR